MSEVAISVSEAARDFLRVLDLVEREGGPAILVRDGKPVATLNLVAGPALTCGELAERWEKLERLPPDEAKAFADDLEHARSTLPLPNSQWD